MQLLFRGTALPRGRCLLAIGPLANFFPHCTISLAFHHLLLYPVIMTTQACWGWRRPLGANPFLAAKSEQMTTLSATLW